jgi:hypothetical protein
MTTDGKGPGGRGDAEPFETDSSNSASITKIVQVPQQRRRLLRLPVGGRDGS